MTEESKQSQEVETSETAASQTDASTEEKSSEQKKGVSRRKFIKYGVTAGVGLGLAVGYRHRWTIIMQAMDYMANKDFDARAFVIVPPKGKVQIICHRSEMGQGVRTAIPMLIAEEMNLTMEQIEIVQGLGDPKYGSQNTDGSRSITRYFIRLREAGASAREMLIQAAAKRWKVKPDECEAKGGLIIHKSSKRKVTYGDVSVEAAKLPLPEKPKLKSDKDFKVIGKSTPGQDLDALVQGKAPFGIDIDLPDMLYGCSLRSPIPGGNADAYDASAAMKIPGVVKVVKLPGTGADWNTNDSVCVLATNTWAAIEGKKTLKVTWDMSAQSIESSHEYRANLKKSLKEEPVAYRDEGNVRGMFRKGKGKVVKAEYQTPFLVHAPMEPLVCTARVKGKTCEVWAPCQDPVRSRKSIAKLLGIKFEDVTFHVTFLGGGFGRKSQSDFVLEAVAVAKKVGRPVKLQWTREDEIKNGFYHAECYQNMAALVGDDGLPKAWHHQSIFPSLMTVHLPNTNIPSEFEVAMGASNMPYRVPHVLVETGYTRSPVRVGWLRSVCNLFHAFGVNSFVDELAANAKVDPIDYRMKLLGKPRVYDESTMQPHDTARTINVIKKTKDAFGWDKPLPKGHGKGFANHFSFLSYVAVAIEASVENGNIKVHRAVCTIDCGLAVNPEGVIAQMEGSVVFGLSAAIHSKITLKDSVVEQSNFHDYRVLRMNEMPKVEVHIINGDPKKPTGVGEPGVPPVAPALAAAIYSATGKRVRTMPFKEHLG